MRPVVQFKHQAFSPSSYWYKQVLKLQHHMLARRLGQHRLACDTPRDFFKRVARTVSEHVGNSVSDWAVEWLKTTLSWDAHCSRDSVVPQLFCTAEHVVGAPDFRLSPALGVPQEQFSTCFSWAARLSQHMGNEYFEQRRTVERLGARTHTRTDTRAVVVGVTPRYHDCNVCPE